MKPLVVLFFGIFFWTQQAFAIGADVAFYTRRGEPFHLILDGRLINLRVTNRLQLHDIPAGYHAAEIRLPGRFGALVHRTRIFLEPGFQADFLVNITGGRRPRVFLTKIAQYPIIVGPRQPYPAPPRQPKPNYDNRYEEHNEQNWDTRSPEVMQTNEVDRLLQTLTDRTSDDSRIAVVKQVLHEALVYAEDLKRILQTFSFDSSKLELAKYAYNKLYDRRNFYLVYDAFTYDSNARELEKYISDINRLY